MAFNHRNGLGCATDDTCECGYRLVTSAYVDAVAPRVPPPFPQIGPEPGLDAPVGAAELWASQAAANAKHARQLASRRSAVSSSVYPCPNCNPEQFLRWQAGAWPYPPRDGSMPTANTSPPTDDHGLFADLAAHYQDGDTVVDQEF